MTKDDIVKMLTTMATISGTSPRQEYDNFVAEGGWELLIKNAPGVYSEALHEEVEGELKGENQAIAQKYIHELVTLADTLDAKGLTFEANEVDKIVASSWGQPRVRPMEDMMWFQNKEKREKEEKEKAYSKPSEEKPAKWLEEAPKSVI